MIAVAIPGFGRLELEHLVLDYNGTLARDGVLIAGVGERLARLAGELRIHVVTADTFGKARAALEGVACELCVLGPDRQDEAKLAYVERLGVTRCAAVGNGRNDRQMLGAAGLGIAVIQDEGASAEALTAARIVCPSIRDALDLLLHPLRLTATLRS